MMLSSPRSGAQIKVINRAGSLGSLANFALNLVRSDSTVYDVPALKAAISSYGIDVSDLN